MKRSALAILAMFAALAPFPAAQRSAQPSKPLDIYIVDTEGGKAALYVSPTGQTLLIDSGNPGGRDTDRIMAAITEASVKQIDYLISTHYHGDHVGGMPELAKRIPIGHFIDHGPSVEQREQAQGFQAAYADLYGKAKHTIVKPGDRVPITGLDWRIVTAGGQGLKAALPGGGKPNPACKESAPNQAARDENAQSVGSVVTFGQWRAIDLGDLTWDNEIELMCPNNPIGTVDVYFVTHHGLDQSGTPAVVHGVQPRVAVMQNGTRKGAGAKAMPTMRSSPGLEDIWQLHWSYTAGIEQNSAGAFIANVDDPAAIAAGLTAPPRGGGGGRGQGGGPPGGGAGAPGAGPAPPTAPPPGAAPLVISSPTLPAPSAALPPGGAPTTAASGAPGGQGGGRGGGAAAAHTPAYWIKVSAQQDGTFTVSNSRNGFSKTYLKRSQAK